MIIPLLLLLLLFGCLGSKPHLSTSISNVSPEHPYEGDTITFTINVVNSGNADANDFTVDLLVDNTSVKTMAVSLSPSSNKTVSFSWVPLSAGDYHFAAKVDSGNIVSEPSAEKETSMELSVLPSEEADAFSIVPSKKAVDVELFDVNSEGIQVAYTYSSPTAELPGYFQLLRYVRNSKEVKIGTVNYADFSTASVLFIDGPTSVEQMAGILSILTDATFEVQNKTINGTEISVLSAGSSAIPLCVWREKGWLKLFVYQELASYRTCENLTGNYDPSYLNGMLNESRELASPLPFNATALGSMQRLSNFTRSEYGAAFEDDEGFYGLYVTKEPYVPQEYVCEGRITNSSKMQVCETMPTSTSTWTTVQRNVGNYSLICLSIPKANDSSIEIEMKALDICYSLNFSGEERVWKRFVDVLVSRCDLPDNFSCVSYDFSDAALKLNLTQNTGRTVVINGFKCTGESNVPTENFQLNQSIILKSNSTVHLEYPCYNATGAPMLENYAYLGSRMYLNYSFEGSNESAVIRGNVSVKKI
ncbi:MAG: hypothetical protein NT130_01910 [Candidatus Micrarchaeota archaeon]|nr:hypothetical protein [Candidatus Micrarchaeota archaeon]